MKIALRTTLNLGSHDCADMKAMSPAMQKAFQRTVDRFSARPCDAAAHPNIVPKISTRIIVDGKEFGSPIQMPPNYRQFYEEALARALPLHDAILTVTQMERSNFVKGTIALSIIAAGLVVAIVYLWFTGFYG